MSALTRQTAETRVRVVLRRTPAEHLAPQVTTGDAFLDHMLVTFARYSGVQLEVAAVGDLQHHLIEDVAITLGMALRRETPSACARYGAATVPMDEALVQAALDLGGRFYYRGRLPSGLYDHFLRSFAENAAMTLHVRMIRGGQRHHAIEAAIKAVGLALRQALTPGGAVFSTKGAVDVAWEEDA